MDRLCAEDVLIVLGLGRAGLDTSNGGPVVGVLGAWLCREGT